MIRSSKYAIAACAAVLAFAGAAAVPAQAYYLGYGNGDPGAWDFWTEQAGGPEQFKAEEAREKQWEMSHLHHSTVRQSPSYAHRAHEHTVSRPMY